MKLTVFILLLGCLQASAFVHAQSITLSLNKAPFSSFIKEVEEQTGYRFVYLKEQMEKASAVTLHVVNSPLLEVLNLSFKDQPLDFTIEDKLIIIRNKKLQQPALPVIELRGRVVNREGEPMAGISIRLKNGSKATVTDESGEFTLREIDGSAILEISGAEIEKMEVPVNGRQYLTITVKIKVSNLDQVIVMAYGQTTQRLNTGNITKVTAEEIERQPVSNPLAALQGRVPGMVVTQTSGVPGSAFKVEIRGRSSLDLSLSRNDPLFIIDGVPFEQGNGAYNQLTSSASMPLNTTQGGLSPMHNVNISDIESIEVLKDADATAIYGSRGANGVILITTKKGRSGSLKTNLSFMQGWSKVTRTMDMLDTEQYIAMRKEAFANDGIALTQLNAPDVILWDTTRYTDFKKLLIGRTAQTTNLQASLSAGNEHMNFLLSGNFLRQNNIFSRELFDTRAGFHMLVGYVSDNKKLVLQFSSNFSSDNNRLLTTDLTGYINTIPNLKLYESDGSLAWQEKGIYYNRLQTITNPLSLLERKYRSLSNNLTSNLNLGYNITNTLILKTVLGYNQFTSEEISINPSTSYQPNLGLLPSANFANGNLKSWIVEPQLQFRKQWGNQHNLTILTGATLQQKNYDSKIIEATQYSNDLLLETPEAAGFLKSSRTYTHYNYGAVFGRAQYDFKKTYLISLSGRRDGSSRFGPVNRYANFASMGIAWIFSKEPFIQQNIKWLSHGKIRGSYGVTGNDQIGDYQYLDLWRATSLYQGVPGLEPNTLYNSNYSWERNRKAELAVEMELIERIFFSASFYRNRSSNQLISYQLPSQTGFSSIIKNFPALVENKGWEIMLNAYLIKNHDFSWNLSGNITFPRNKLIEFPNLETSSYRSNLKIGESVNSYTGSKFLRLDPATGVYIFEQPIIYEFRGSLDPKWYGGLQNNLHFGNWKLSFLFEFRKQLGRNYLHVVRSMLPGRPYNQPTIVMNRWQKPGDETAVQMFTNRPTGPAGIAANYLGNSDGIYSDASFIRMKNILLSFDFSVNWAKGQRSQQASLFVSAQNLFVLTQYKGSDPESQNLYALPPLRTIAIGIQLNF